MKIFIVLLLILLFACSQKTELNWYKGNLHTHSYWSDGDEFPEMIMDWYKSHGYNLALTDHNTLAAGEKWKLIPKSPIRQKGFENYLAKYGRDWVIYREDTGRVSVKLKTLAEYRSLFEENGRFLIIQGEELSDSYDKKPLHMNINNLKNYVEPQHGNSVAEVLQNNINAAIRERENSGLKTMIHVNHPNFYYAISVDDMISLNGERFFELYNGHPSINNEGDSAHVSIERMWDMINIAYTKMGKPLMYGLATDDTHNYHLFGAEYANAGRGWVMVHADRLEADALVTALENGQFYATTGVILSEYSYTDHRIRIAIKAEESVRYEIHFIGLKEGKEDVELFQSTEDTEVEFIVEPNMKFARVKVISDKVMKNPVAIEGKESAWTQPVTY
ncbi:MAG: histidinol-phosphatase [Calditrichaeota bacterium]|nr:histidinol-phosphatase [Calditrichota bacterium]